MGVTRIGGPGRDDNLLFDRVFDKAREGAHGWNARGPASSSRTIRSLRRVNNELADKGFLVTTTDDLINWARTG